MNNKINKSRFLLLLILFFYAINLNAKNNYWQQEVNCQIEVALDDEKHELNGSIRIQYTNNSPDTLTFIYMHLWPNAYKNELTAFGQQQLENGNTDFYYSSKQDRGFIDGIDFRANEQVLDWKYDDQHADIAKIQLKKPLTSGDSIAITTPFRVKIPADFSRLGHVEQSYQITQWYPKPAVYDKDGWHPMSYLNQGEFYSEFGSFDVKITLPANYVVGATGQLQEGETHDFLWNKIEQTKRLINSDTLTNYFPPSATETRTWHYKQDNIHDFAWFADKRYLVKMKGGAVPNSYEELLMLYMFLPESAEQWQKVGEYINDGVQFYSSQLGDYPYSTLTVVEGALSAGGGMEYPMITVIAPIGNAFALETVVVHEIGHNWFYGILASNEREHPWLDEGINSYYEKRYLRNKYPDRKALGAFANLKLAARFDLDHLSHDDINYYGYLHKACRHRDQAITLPSKQYTNANYGIIVYGKAEQAFTYLEAYLGTKEFDRIMKKYYAEFQFKHPQPEDLRRIFESETGRLLDWFFDELLPTTKKIDYRIKKVRPKAEQIGKKQYDEITLKNNKKGVRGPYTISALKDEKVIHKIWYDGFAGEMAVLFPSMDYDELYIDYEEVIPEINRKNNRYKTTGLFKKSRPTRLQFLGSLENSKRNHLFVAPVLGGNKYDGFMLGAAFYNNIFPNRNFEYTLAPMFAFKSKRLVGMGDLAYHIRPQSGFADDIKIGLSAMRFTHGEKIAQTQTTRDEIFREPFGFFKIAPSLNVHFRKNNPRSSVDYNLNFRHVNIQKDEFDCPSDTAICFTMSSVIKDSYYVNELRFDINNKRAINPFQANLMVRQGARFVNASLEGNITFNYRKKSKKGVHARLFAGAFLYNNLRPGLDNDFKFSMSSIKGRRDYMFDHVFLGRLERGNFWGTQIVPAQGGFKLRTDQSGTEIGITDNWLVALNLEVDMPNALPLSVYASAGYHRPKELVGITENFLWEVGATVKLLPDIIEIYVPLVASNDYLNALELADVNFFERISFFINFNALNPVKRVRTIDL